ncbi:MAG TPA: hypothetical protein VMH90_02825 [Thermoplasmata archaeon]|nr:hypothetical protein [Thermoplasmata archaeon]
MDCSGCGAPLGAGFAYCPACGRPTAPLRAETGREPFESLVRDLAAEADRLGKATARVAERALDRADAALKDPPAAARHALDRARREMERARRDLDELLR